jgi:hypothetical protein
VNGLSHNRSKQPILPGRYPLKAGSLLGHGNILGGVKVKKLKMLVVRAISLVPCDYIQHITVYCKYCMCELWNLISHVVSEAFSKFFFVHILTLDGVVSSNRSISL